MINLISLIIIPLIFTGIILYISNNFRLWIVLKETNSIKQVTWLEESNYLLPFVLRVYYSHLTNLSKYTLPSLKLTSFWVDYSKSKEDKEKELNNNYKTESLRKAGILLSLVLYLVIILLWFKYSPVTLKYQLMPDNEIQKRSWNLNISLGVDGISLPFLLLVGFILPIVFLSNWTTLQSLDVYYIIIIILLEMFLIIVFLVLDFIMFYVFFESTLPLLFVLIGLYGASQKVRAGFYLFLYTLFGSLFMLVAFVKIIGGIGSDNFENSGNNFTFFDLEQILWLLLLLSFSVKTPIVPVHIWLPLAHSDANVSGSILLASIVLKLALYAFLRISIGILFIAATKLNSFVLGLCSISILYSSYTTIRQFDLKVLVAYSSIAVRRKAFINYEFYYKILPVSYFGKDNQLKFQGKPEVELSMLGKRFERDETASFINKSVKFSMIRPKLVEVQYLFASTRGLQLSCAKLCIIRICLLGYETYKLIVNRSWVTNPIKDLSEQSKGNKINKGTPGLPKGSNSHGNRDLILLIGSMPIIPIIHSRIKINGKLRRLFNSNPLFHFNQYINQKIEIGKLGRRSVDIIGLFRQYSSGATVKILEKLTDLNKRSILKPYKIIDRDLYADFILNKDMFLIAYDKLKSNPGNMTPGINPDTLDGLNLEIIEEILAKLRNESFQFSMGRRTLIPKKDGNFRSLTIGNPRDKLVQEILRMVLEAIYEPLFKDESYGFRVNRGCHSALRSIFTKFVGVTWCIEGDISNCFDSINHVKLMDLISKKIRDKRFNRLIWKALKTGYFHFKIYKNNLIGTPQGSIISPILANIYLDQLDDFILSLKSEFDQGEKAKRNPSHSALTYKITKLKEKKLNIEEEIDKLKKKSKRSRKKENIEKINLEIKEKIKLWKEQSKIFRGVVNERRSVPYAHPNDPDYKKLTYIRYADDWIVGIRGRYKDAELIKQKIADYCCEIGLTLNKEKTRITNIRRKKVLFLGVEIKYTKHITYSDHGLGFKQRNTPRFILLAPIRNIINKLTQSGFIKNRKSHPKYLWMPYSHIQIINQYNSVFRGILNYYSFAFNRGAVVSILNFFLKGSCTKLLATKFSLRTQAKVYKKFGKGLSPRHNIEKDEKRTS